MNLKFQIKMLHLFLDWKNYWSFSSISSHIINFIDKVYFKIVYLSNKTAKLNKYFDYY